MSDPLALGRVEQLRLALQDPNSPQSKWRAWLNKVGLRLRERCLQSPRCTQKQREASMEYWKHLAAGGPNTFGPPEPGELGDDKQQ